jgi:hypothetical protein
VAAESRRGAEPKKRTKVKMTEKVYNVFLADCEEIRRNDEKAGSEQEVKGDEGAAGEEAVDVLLKPIR